MPEISVIVPVYKVEKYIHRCVDSILAQTFTDFELVLVDDGSPDNCGTICDEYANKDNRIHVIHKTNGGLSDARNAGMDYAINKGVSEWMIFVDSDDWVAIDFLEALYKICIKHDADIGVCRHTRCCEQPKEDITTDKDLDRLATLNEALFYQGNIACYAWAKLYRTELISDYRFPVGLLMEDYYVIPEIMLAAKRIAVIEKALYYYFINDEGILGNLTLKHFQDAWKGYERQIDLFDKYGEEHLKRVQINSFVKNISVAYNLTRNNQHDYTKKDTKETKEYGKRIIKTYKSYIDFDDADILSALRVFFVRYQIRVTASEAFNHSNFFVIKSIRKIYYKLVFPKIKKIYLIRYEKKLNNRLKNQNFSIICSNCIGGFIYHRLGLKFLSPTINCFIEPSEFIRFCENLKYYLSLEPEFIETEKPYPVARLDDIKVYFNHSENEQDAKEMWNKRKTRVNYENLYVILYNRYAVDEVPLSKDEIIRAGKIQCKNLIVLSDIPYPDIPYVLYIPKKDTDLGQLYFDSDQYGIRSYEKRFDYVTFLNAE